MIDWTHWHNEPLLIGGLVFLGWLWAVLAGPARGRLARSTDGTVPPFPRRAAWKFYPALVIFYLAVGSPLDQIAEGYLLSAHMFQHQLLIYPAAILFLQGVPHWMIDSILARPGARALSHLLTRPIACGFIFLLVFGAWHAPWLYSAALNYKLVHVSEHILFFGAALFYWWPLLSPSRVIPPAKYGTQMLYLVGVTIGMMPIHAYITFSHDTLYPTYEYAPRLIATLSPQDDQLLAGAGMQIVAIFVSLAAFGIAFYRWYEEGERSGAASHPRRTKVRV